MSAAADSLRNFLAPLLPGWKLQFGRWVDGKKADSYCVIKPAGGLQAEVVRYPQFTLSLIGPEGGSAGDVSDAADAVIEAMRTSSGDLISLQPGEPAYSPTSDGRHVFEIAVSAITN